MFQGLNVLRVARFYLISRYCHLHLKSTLHKSTIQLNSYAVSLCPVHKRPGAQLLTGIEAQILIHKHAHVRTQAPTHTCTLKALTSHNITVPVLHSMYLYA